jgi:hypothetical protein
MVKILDKEIDIVDDNNVLVNEITEVVEEIKTFKTTINEIRDTCVFVYINGWNCAVDFLNSDIQSKQYKVGSEITIEYTGDLINNTTNGYSLHILPLK